jgi:hypothetical protein
MYFLFLQTPKRIVGIRMAPPNILSNHGKRFQTNDHDKENLAVIQIYRTSDDFDALYNQELSNFLCLADVAFNFLIVQELSGLCSSSVGYIILIAPLYMVSSCKINNSPLYEKSFLQIL